jgi:hypothetical protein
MSFVVVGLVVLRFASEIESQGGKLMSDGSDRLSKLAYFLVGGGIGAVVALLFAPRTGRETREMIAQRLLKAESAFCQPAGMWVIA